MRRGMSTIIATILMILLVITAVGVVWVVIQNVLTEESEGISSGLARIVLTIQDDSVNVSGSKVSMIIHREIGQGDLMKIKILLYDSTGDSYTEDIDASNLGELDGRKFSIRDGGFGSDITKISIAPIIESGSGKGTIQEITDTYKFP